MSSGIVSSVTNDTRNEPEQLSSSTPPHQRYNDLKQESSQLLSKIVEVEMDRNEHLLVEETLRPLDPNRRAYRLVGEILVERTVAEVLPSIVRNRENMDQTILYLRQTLEKQQKEANELKMKHNIQD